MINAIDAREKTYKSTVIQDEINKIEILIQEAIDKGLTYCVITISLNKNQVSTVHDFLKEKGYKLYPCQGFCVDWTICW